MNFLAHCLIAEKSVLEEESLLENDRDGHLIVGGLIGDFIKGPIPATWPASLQAGVSLHRRIDAYSNSEPAIKRCCRRFPAELRRLAPVFVDIIADHCLALDWRTHHRQPLADFSARCYSLAAAQAHWLDDDAQRGLNWIIEEDALHSYRHPEAMERGLRSITRRLGHQHLNDALLKFVHVEWLDLKADFQSYFPPLVEHGRQWVRAHLDGQGRLDIRRN